MIKGELKLAAFVDADLFVLPSYAENFGGVIIEALACGLPVVISDQVNIHRELSDAGAATVVTSSIGRNRISNFDEWVRLDLEYIDRWSLWLDMRILGRTVWAVFSGSGS